MAAPYHADATVVPSGAPSIASHTPNTHDDGTSGDVHSLVVQGSNQRSYSKFDGTKRRAIVINLIIQQDATFPRTDNQTGGGTFSLASHTPKYNAEGTTADVANPQRESV
eukprot:scaffold126164_cov43-Attheya_sp.AAC.1